MNNQQSKHFICTLNIIVHVKGSLGLRLDLRNGKIMIANVVEKCIKHGLQKDDILVDVDKEHVQSLEQVHKLMKLKDQHVFVFSRELGATISKQDFKLSDALLSCNGMSGFFIEETIPGTGIESKDFVQCLINDRQPWPLPDEGSTFVAQIFSTSLDVASVRNLNIWRNVNLVNETSMFTDVNNSQELVISSEIVSAMCPISHQRIINPIKGAQCKHNNCIDMMSLVSLRSQSKGGSVNCPICNQSIDEPVCDKIFEKALNDNPGVSRFVFEPHSSESSRIAPVIDSGESKSLVTSSIVCDLSYESSNEPEPMPGTRDKRNQYNHRSRDYDSDSDRYTSQGEYGPENELKAHITKLDLSSAKERATRVGMSTLAENAKWGPCELFKSEIATPIRIGGTNVLFPYPKPLKPQFAMMGRILDALKHGKHAMIESPTGTGKTLAILCSALAWQRSNDLKNWSDYDGKPSAIIYCTRTHSQAQQISHALQSTAYRPIMTVLGSRSQLCISPIARSPMNSVGLDTACRDMLRSKSCQYASCGAVVNTASIIHRATRPRLNHDSQADPGGLFDIEDLVTIGNQLNSCPYYMSKNLCESAQLIIAPYQYVLDENIRQQMFPGISSFVVIFDEAHNIESACMDVGSKDIQLKKLLDIVRELCILMSKGSISADPHSEDIETDAPGGNSDSVELCMKVMNSLTQYLVDLQESHKFVKKHGPSDVVEVKTYAATNLATQITPGVNQFFDDANISAEDIAAALAVCTQLESTLTHRSKRSGTQAAVAAVQQVNEILRVLQNVRNAPASYCAFITMQRNLGEIEYAGHARNDFPNRKTGSCCRESMRSIIHGNYLRETYKPRYVMNIRFALLDPSVVFDSCSSFARSIILASGTLFPMNPLELGENFASNLLAEMQLDHVIKHDQIYAKIISRSPSKMLLDGSYKATSGDSTNYNEQVAQTIIALFHSLEGLTGGSLVFFPSYSKLSSFHSVLESLRLLPELEKKRGPVLIESSSASEGESFEQVRDRFSGLVDKGTNPILLAVFRGRMSEGIDFSGAYCRVVICVGIPYPNISSADIKYKRLWNDAKSRKIRKFTSGGEWYTFQAFRAVNQALGRVIRHQHDYGCLFLLDSRYEGTLRKSITMLAKWLRPFLKNDTSMNCEDLKLAVDNMTNDPLPINAKENVTPPDSNESLCSAVKRKRLGSESTISEEPSKDDE